MVKLRLGWASHVVRLDRKRYSVYLSEIICRNVFYVYVYGSVHHNIFYEITNRCSYMQSILFHCQVHSTCFGCLLHPSSGVQFLNCIYSHWYKPQYRPSYLLPAWPAGHAGSKQLRRYYGLYQWLQIQFKNCTPDDGCVKHPKHVE